MPKAVLAGLRKYPVRISAVSAMLDSGGSAGRERKEYRTKISFGDFRRAALALAGAKKKNIERFAYRYETGPLAGHVVANLYCSALVNGNNNIEKSVNELIEDIKEDLNIPPEYKLIPATLDNSHLAAELENGKIVLGEGNIDVPSHNGELKIKKVFLVPSAKAYHICNAMTKYGETNSFSVADFTREVEKMLAADLDYVVYNTSKPSQKVLRKYKRKHKELVSPVEIDKGLPKEKFIGRSLLKKDALEYDPKKVSQIITSLI